MPNVGNFAGVVLAHLVAIAGCYNPEVKDCTVQCAGENECASGQVCNKGWCTKDASHECSKQDGDENDLTPDAAAVAADAPDSTACEQGCTNGTCQNGVCVIDCSAPFACRTADIYCPPNLPCRVVCGYDSCEKKIICGTAASCAVECSGESSCNDEVLCNGNRCNVTCSGTNSCARRTKCSGSCACDVTCTGTGSCREVSECTDSTCRLGNGCTSQLVGCDSC